MSLLFAGLAHAQLPAKSTWKYSVVSGGGMSARFLIFLDTQDAPSRRAREWWTVETGTPRDGEHTPLTVTVRNGSGSKRTAYTTWPSSDLVLFTRDGDANATARAVVDRHAPPRVLSMERVPCTSSLLGGVGGTCAGRPGGPLHQPDLPLLVVVRGDVGRTERTLAAIGAFILTGGVLFPGTANKSVVASLDQSPSQPLSPLLTAWRKSPRTPAALEKVGLAADVDAETLGALLVLAGKPNLDVLEALTRRAPEPDRWPLVRLARQSGADDRLAVRLVARLTEGSMLLAPIDEQERALQASALAHFDPRLLRGVDGLLQGEMPTLRAVAATAKSLDDEAPRALEAEPLVAGEGIALAMLMSKPAAEKAMPRFIERLPDEEGLALINWLVRDLAEARRATLLLRLPAWVDRVLRGEHGEALLFSVTNDDDRVKLLDGAWKRAAPEDREHLLLLGMRTVRADDTRLQLLRAWSPPTSLAQCTAVLKTFTSDDGRSAGGRLLLPGVPTADRDAFLADWLKGLHVLRGRTKPGEAQPNVRALIDTTQDVDADGGKLLETTALQPGEAVTVTQLMSGAAVRASLPRFIERLPDEEGVKVVDALLRSDAERNQHALLASLPKWVDRVIAGPSAVELMNVFSSGDSRLKFIDTVAKRAPAELKPRLFVLSVGAMAFDDARLSVLRARLPKTLAVTERLDALRVFSGDERRSDAARLLIAGLGEEDRRAVVGEWVRLTRDVRRKMDVVKEQSSTVTLDEAVTLYRDPPFDSNRSLVAATLLPLVPAADRAEFFTHCVEKMAFDSGRMELLKFPDRPALSDAQKQRVLRAFVFDREKARPLLQ